MGLKPGDTVMVVAETCPELLVLAWGVAFAGCVLVPLHSSIPEAEFKDALKSVRPSFLVVDGPQALQRLKRALRPLAGRVAIFYTSCVLSDAAPGARPMLRVEDVVSGRDDVLVLQQLEELGRGYRAARKPEEIAETLSSDSPAMILHTPGTQGEQRGVVLSHGNLLYQARTLSLLLPVSSADTQLLFLPLSHVLGVIAFLSAVAAGARIAVGGGMRTLLEDLQDAKPTYMVGVPRVFEKIVDKTAVVTSDFSVLSKQLFKQGIDACNRMEERREQGLKPDVASFLLLEAARRTVYRRCSELFGGQIRFLISGGAPLGVATGQAIRAFGFPVLEGFGLTETSGATHINRVDAPKLGTVGLPLPGVEVRVAQDQEVLVRGPGVMLGYLEPDGEVLPGWDEDGWFRTGDLGTVDDRGYLRITGRKKNMIVTATGKNVVPSRLETAISTAIPMVSHCVVAGDRRSYLVALITLNPTVAAAWAEEQGIKTGSFDALRTDVRLYQHVERSIDVLNQGFAPHERIRRFAILESDFSVETGELTHDLKVKRAVVLKKYEHVCRLLYKER
jgi:long-chain acyl-CoA synthetase